MVQFSHSWLAFFLQHDNIHGFHDLTVNIGLFFGIILGYKKIFFHADTPQKVDSIYWAMFCTFLHFSVQF